jgi:toxin ParE1/3/4
MTRFRVSHPAQADLETILAVSLERWGEDGRARYTSLLAAAFRTIARDPEGPTTRDRSALLAGIRSFHVRHARGGHGVREPVHVVYFRVVRQASIEIVRVLHERMDPTAHLAMPLQRGRKRGGR